MDMMELRRRLLMRGVGIVGIGDFTKYEKKTLTFPNAGDSSTWETGAIVPCSFTPKLVVCYTEDDNTAGCVYNAVFCLMMEATSYYIGGARARGTTGTLSSYSYYYNTGASAGMFKYDNGTFYACRVSSGIYWNPNKAYTFEIYG